MKKEKSIMIQNNLGGGIREHLPEDMTFKLRVMIDLTEVTSEGRAVGQSLIHLI